MNEFMKRVRSEIKKGVTVNGVHGPGFIAESKAKFVAEKGYKSRSRITVEGLAFSGRVIITPHIGDVQEVLYNVMFKKRIAYGKLFYTHKRFTGVSPQQLTAVIDAVINGTGVVEEVKKAA